MLSIGCAKLMSEGRWNTIVPLNLANDFKMEISDVALGGNQLDERPFAQSSV